MCYSAIYPVTAKSANAHLDLLRITRIFNRWLKMIADYGKLDRLCAGKIDGHALEKDHAVDAESVLDWM